MTFTPHNLDDRLTKISPVDYDPNARCNRFLTFVKEITSGDVDKAQFLQKMLGYGMSGDTRYECLFILYGATTRNGKGTLCESVLKVLGTYGCTARPETLSMKPNANSHNPSEDIARLAGVRFANISEPGKGMVLNAAQVKSMSGKSTSAIARQLTNEGIPTPGKKKVWQTATVDSILTNEKYKGAALLQKKYTVDFLTKTMKTNEGEVPQYYVEDSHPAIIKPAEWEAVQVEMEQHRSKGRRHDCSSPFSGKIFCGDCGGVYGSKTWHSTDKYRRVIWQCNHKYDSGEKCGTPHLREEVLKERFLEALAQYMDDPDERIEGLRYVQKAMTDTTFVDADLEEAGQKMELLSGMIRNCIMMNASATVGEREYQQQYAELTRQFEEQKERYEALQDRRKQMNETAIIFGGMLFELWELDEVPVTFKESLWHTLVDHATVYGDERIVFRFKDGTEVTTML